MAPSPLQDVPEEYQRLLGNLRPTLTIPKFVDQAGDFIAATDGTVKNGRGGAAVLVHSNNNNGTLQAVVPVDGTNESTTSYRAELAGILTVLLITHFILNGQGKTALSGDIYCDNEAAVNTYNKLSGESHGRSTKQQQLTLTSSRS